LSEGLADTQAEKLKTLVEDIESKDVDTFAEKVKTIKESYFSGSKANTKKEELSEDVNADVNPYTAHFKKKVSDFD